MVQPIWRRSFVILVVAFAVVSSFLPGALHAAGDIKAEAAQNSAAASPEDAAVRIEAALNQRLKAPLEFTETPLNQITDVLAEDYDIPIQFDVAALDAVASSPEVEASCNVGNISLRSALNLLLRNAGAEDLTYVIVDEVLMITTNEEAERRLEVRVFRVDDLVADDHAPDANGTDADFRELINVIVTNVEHESWMENGTGEGEVQSLSPGMLVVSQTARVQTQVAELLQALRRVKQTIVADAPSAGESAKAPVTRSLPVRDKVFETSEAARDAVRHAIVSSTNWRQATEGLDEDAVFVSVLPDRVLVRHVPQVLREVEQVLAVISPRNGGDFCGGYTEEDRDRMRARARQEATPDLAEPANGGQDGAKPPSGGGVF